MSDVIEWSQPQNPLCWDEGGMDKTVHGIVHGAKFLCSVPQALGAPVSINVRDGKILVQTESGIPLIVPLC
jgi:hypothetical protein